MNYVPHTYALTVSYENTNPWFILEVYSQLRQDKQKYQLYTVPLALLHPNETRLNDGRFASYSQVAQPYSISTTLTGLGVTAYDYFSNRLAWISDNVTQLWSLNMSMRSAHEACYDWSFENEADALLFKLTF